jgi:hypothetical protein
MGGNVFIDVVPFDHSQIGAIAEHLDSVLSQIGVSVIPIGSTANPVVGKKSGDFDVLVEERILAQVFNEDNPRNIRKKLKDLFDKSGDTTTLNGIAVHVRVPINNEAYQADILVTPQAKEVSKFHIHKIPANSKYKGVHKHLAMMYLAKSKGLLWSAFQGLFNRNKEGKRGDFITNKLDTIAYLLIGVNGKEQDFDCFESIVAALPVDVANKMIADLKEDPSWKEIA